jgi:hypothetical protein
MRDQTCLPEETITMVTPQIPRTIVIIRQNKTTNITIREIIVANPEEPIVMNRKASENIENVISDGRTTREDRDEEQDLLALPHHLPLPKEDQTTQEKNTAVDMIL